MYYHCRRKPKYTFSTETKQRKPKTGFFAITLVLLLVMAAISLFLRDLSTKIAVSDAVDIVTKTVNDSINKVIGEGVYGFDFFVSLVKDESGNITAITSNMAHINTLSTEILNSVIESTENGTIEVKIPAGNLTGLNLLVGKGPDVTVDIVMLTSSKVDFKTISFPPALIRLSISSCLRSRSISMSSSHGGQKAQAPLPRSLWPIQSSSARCRKHI